MGLEPEDLIQQKYEPILEGPLNAVWWATPDFLNMTRSISCISEAFWNLGDHIEHLQAAEHLLEGQKDSFGFFKKTKCFSNVLDRRRFFKHFCLHLECGHTCEFNYLQVSVSSGGQEWNRCRYWGSTVIPFIVLYSHLHWSYGGGMGFCPLALSQPS